MKRSFLIFLVLLVLGATISAWGQCPEDPHDSGQCDTMYIEPWPADTILQGSGPYLVRVPIYVTNDLVYDMDSIPAFVIPLCYTHSNPSKYCSVSAFYNDLAVYPTVQYIPGTSIFQHITSDAGDTLIHNWMMALSEKPYPNGPNIEDWDTKILEMASDSSWVYWNEGADSMWVEPHWWMALAAAAKPDRRMEDGSRILLATMTFNIEDSMKICIDTMFWPPSSRLAWVTYWGGGGYATTKIPRPGMGDPNSFKLCFNALPPDPVDCGWSYSDPCLVACPAGDIPFKVYLIDSYGHPVPNYSNVRLDLSGCSGIIPCASETSWPIVYPDGPSDANGIVTFHVHAGGCDNVHKAQIISRCGIIGYVSVKSVDTDGNHQVRVNDWHGIGVDPCNDYNCNKIVNYFDLNFFEKHIFHGCDLDPCVLVSPDLTVIPDTLLPAGSSHLVRLFIKNNYSDPCTAQFVDFYRAGFGQGTSLFLFDTYYLWQELMPGDTAVAETDFVVPGPGSGYILSKLYTECCDHSIDAVFNFTQRICPPDSMTYVFPLQLSVAPTYVETLEYMPDTLGWYWFIYETGGIPDSVAIVTPDTSVLGVTGGLTLYFFDQSWELLGYRTCEVRITLNSGDVNSDCIVNLGDVLSLISYLYKGGPAPNPHRAGDVNCDCTLDLGDILYMISYLYKGGPAPVSSETCECGYKEWFPY